LLGNVEGGVIILSLPLNWYFFVKDVCRLETEARKAEMEEFQASVLLR